MMTLKSALPALAGAALLALASAPDAQSASVESPRQPASAQPDGSSAKIASSYLPASAYWKPEHTSGRCITAHGGTRKGAKIDQYKCVGGANQKWSFVNVSATPPTYTIRPVSNAGLCVDIQGSDYRKGRQPILWNCNGRTNQKFWINCAGRLSKCNVHPFYGGARDKCLSVKGGSTANNTPVILWSCNRSKDQRFTLR
ncbi:RICIN domain-containing protein [Streptomyces sp. NPDC028722]|uniref:RICIN domain-containing protein n=1 Tax=Streptomyces sp. NPDC028722 TaxID=3155016 RepID=UPI0033C31180